ncbi:MAG: hypothetical protein IPL23_08135 [Saprospiraceae bacterium]|nr:hypothetical protein [Saprospiraceae bacterium]
MSDKQKIILANSVNLGHISIGEHVVIGGMSAVHQFVKTGDHAMIGGGSFWGEKGCTSLCKNQ